MKSTPLLRLLAPLVLGIGVGHFLLSWLLPFHQLLLWVSGSLLICCIVALFQRKLARLTLPLSVALLFSLGVLLFVHQQRKKIAPIAPRQSLTFRGIITDVPHRTARGWRVQLRMIAPQPVAQWQVYLTDTTIVPQPASKAPASSGQAPPSLRTPLYIGQEILAHGRVTALLSSEGHTKDHYSDYLLRQNILATAHCYPNEWRIFQGNHEKLTLGEDLRSQREQWVAVYQQQLPPHTAAILSAMTLAQRETLDRDTQLRYSQGGASHILALSGLHLSILFGAFTLVFGSAARRFGRNVHLAVTLLGILIIWCFAAFVGFPISLVRATLMLTLAHLFSLWHHRPGALHGLFLSMLIMLVYAPDWLFDVSFQLSCAAVGGILLFASLFPVPHWLEPLSKRAAELQNTHPTPMFLRALLRIGRFFFTLFTVSLSAQLATAPIVAYHFHQLPWSGLFTSLFVIPAAYLLLLLGLLFLLLSPLRSFIAPLLTWTIDTMERGLTFFSKDLFAPLPLYPSLFTAVLSFCTVFGLLALLLRAHRQRVSLVSNTLLALVLLLLPLLSYQYDRLRSRPQTSLLIYPTSGVTTLHAITADGTSWLFASDTLRAQSALRQVAHDDWQPQGLNIQWIPLSVLENPAPTLQNPAPTLPNRALAQQNNSVSVRPLLAPRCIVFGRQRIAVVDSPLSRAFPAQPLSVDVLLVGHDVHRPLSHLLCYYRPRQVVLSAALTDFYRRQYLTDAAKLHLPCYDLSEQPILSLQP